MVAGVWDDAAVAARESTRARRTLRDAHSEATRAALIRSARRLFAARGYGTVSIEEIVRRAKVTSGALYHHFSDKRALFDAACEQV